MHVRETNLKQLVQGEKQFRVPLWQRQYTWRIADHRLLWRDIMEQYTRAADGGAASQPVGLEYTIVEVTCSLLVAA